MSKFTKESFDQTNQIMKGFVIIAVTFVMLMNGMMAYIASTGVTISPQRVENLIWFPIIFFAMYAMIYTAWMFTTPERRIREIAFNL